MQQSQLEDESDAQVVHKISLNTIPEQTSFEIRQDRFGDIGYVSQSYSDIPLKSINLNENTDKRQ